jgi:hypothetical protein
MTIFNAEVLLNAATEKSHATSIPPLPEQEFIFTVTKIDFKQPKDGVIIMELSAETTDPVAVAATGINPSRSRWSTFVDLTESGLLDDTDGKNIGIGKIREAVGQNTAGVPWAPAALMGQQFRGKIVQKADAKDATVIRSEIGAVAKL